MGVTIQQILSVAFPAYAASRPLEEDVRRAAWAMSHCRTERLGAHVEACPNGHVRRVHFNSCRHRSCPQCAHARTQRWLVERLEKIRLPCDHYHAIFTIASELQPLWRFNKQRMADLLFRAVRETLLELLGDPKYLGATPGVIATLHTWGQTLQLHPHIHCLVTGGGVDADGRWRPVEGGYLLPTRVASKMFRGKLLDFVRRDLRAGRLEPPPGDTARNLRHLTFAIQKKKWNVHIRERYAHGTGVLTYLARYVRGGPIKNQRLLAFTKTSVTFRYRDNRRTATSPTGVMTLDVDTFLQRLLQHVPPKGLHVVRSFGLFAPSNLACVSDVEPQIDPSDDPGYTPTPYQRRRCPRCAEPLVVVAFAPCFAQPIPRGPPRSLASSQP